jgi:CBS domain-containing protein
MSLHRFEQGAVCAQLDETAFTIARKMRDHRVGSVVVTRGDVPLGIITDRDIAIRVVAGGRSPHFTLAADIVTYDATTIPNTASLDTAARMMRERGVRRLPIVNEQNKVTGVVSADDLVALFTAELADVGASVQDVVDSTESR